MTFRKSVLPCMACAAALSIAAPAAPAVAQLAFGHSNQPVEILADQNIEWQREQQRYIARGNASAKQGDTTVYADVLTAFYRPQPKPAGQADVKAPDATAQKPDADKPAPGSGSPDPQGSTQIYRYEAEGHVRIVTPTDTALGDHGIFDVDTGVLVMTGHGLKLTTPNETVTARDSLEYWQTKQMAVARGDALVVTRDERRMTGDILTSYFADNRTDPPPATARNVKASENQTGKAKGAKATPVSDNSEEGGGGNNRLQRIEGFGHVHVSTPTEIVTADRGVYNADTGIAMMSDNVRITRGDNQLNGDFAEVNLNTGISRLLTRSDGNGKAQVRGLFIPQQKQSAASAPAGGQAAAPADDKKARQGRPPSKGTP